MKNNLTTTQKTEVVLAKGKSLLGITAKLLSGSKSLAPVNTHKDITIIADLMWENVPNPEEHSMSWDDAIEYAKNLRLGGYNDWRLPTIGELKAVVRECGGINVFFGDHNINNIGNENRQNKSYQACYVKKRFASFYYWSSGSCSVLKITSSAESLYFVNGGSSHSLKGNSFYVRCVRAGQ